MTSKGKGKQIEWSDFIKHNKDDDCWVAVRGKVYDVTKWVPNHPGGRDAILVNSGRDATVLFEIYHPTKTASILEKYYIGDLSSADVPMFPEPSDFYKTLKTKIEDYFKEKKIEPRFSPQILLYSVASALICWIFQFWAMFVVGENPILAGIMSAISGIAGAIICFTAVHEGSHFSTTKSPFMWRLLGSFHDIVNGSSYYIWIHQHLLGHHPFTNVSHYETEHSIDPDTNAGNPDVRRIRPHQKFFKHYAFQVVYLPMLYGILAIRYRINDMVSVLSTKRIGAIRLQPLDSYHTAVFFFGKAFFVFQRFILPYFFLGLTFNQIIFLFLVSDLIGSYWLGISFSVNHVIPQAVWPKVDKETNTVNMDWATMQLATTLDYAHDSPITTFFVGSLNFQVVHHLFPWISQSYYPEIAPIVKQHCKKYGIQYHYVDTFAEAFQNHLKFLSIMGTDHH